MNNQDLYQNGWNLVDKGYKIFPCGAGEKGKAPLVKDWRNNYITENVEVAKTINDFPTMQYWGVITSPSFTVIDVDSQKMDAEGLEVVRGVIGASQPLQRTQSGGVHYAFDSSQLDIKTTTKVNNLDVDIRADGGYVCCYDSSAFRNDFSRMPTKLVTWLRGNKVSNETIIERDYSYGEIASAIWSISPDVSQETWAKVIWAAAKLGNYSPEVQRLLEEWSHSSEKYEKTNTTKDLLEQWAAVPNKNFAPTMRFLKTVAKEYPVGQEVEEPKVDLRKLFSNPRTFGDLDSVPSVEYVVQDLIALGHLTILSADPKAGKSTFLMSMLADISNEKDFLNLKTQPTKVMYFTEEGDQSMKILKERVEITNTEGMALVTKFEVGGSKLSDMVDILVEIEADYNLYIFDTLNVFAQIEDLNDYSKVGKALQPFKDLRDATGAAVVIVHHNNKAGSTSNGNRSMLGSTAVAGDVDNIITFFKDNPNHDDTNRVVCVSGRTIESATHKVFWNSSDKRYMVKSIEDGVAPEMSKFLTIADSLGIEFTMKDYTAAANSSSRSTANRELAKLCEMDAIAKMPAEAGKPCMYINKLVVKKETIQATFGDL